MTEEPGEEGQEQDGGQCLDVYAQLERVLVDSGQPLRKLGVRGCDVRIAVDREPNHEQREEEEPGGGPDAIPNCVSHMTISSEGVILHEPKPAATPVSGSIQPACESTVRTPARRWRGQPHGSSAADAGTSTDDRQRSSPTGSRPGGLAPGRDRGPPLPGHALPRPGGQ